MTTFIASFIHQLALAQSSPICENPYASERPFPRQRRHNLQHYLTLMAHQQPKLLLIGEAPGYRGCRLTGIPFVSPHLLSKLHKRFQQPAEPFQAIAEWPQIQREASATIVWQTIGSWHPLPLLWNIFPFHPHPPDQPQTNRPPTTSEITAGRPFLNQLLQIFPQVTLVAVGKKAAAGLTKWGMAHTAVRHPSHGGAKAFQTGLTQLK